MSCEFHAAEVKVVNRMILSSWMCKWMFSSGRFNLTGRYLFRKNYVGDNFE